ncbi:receptor-like protein 35 [Quercus suber]|uniref:Receptor-like protein 35 n=1 Tax=Quercus suber TaxID=58331 RepID=A0AAW0JKS3_QUESU
MPSNVKDISRSVGCGRPKATRPTLQIVDLASNNFIGKLSIKALANSKSLIFNNEAQSKYLQSDVEQGNNLYYQDVIIVTIKGLEIKLVKILTLFTSIDLLCNNLDGIN